jgi:hypothetical protein
MMRFRSRMFRGGVIAAFAMTLIGVGLTQASVATPYCGITWGSLTKHANATRVAPMTNIRAGRHACYDRLVIDVRAPGANGFTVKYVSQVVNDPRGNVVALRGGARLQIVVYAPANDLQGRSTYNPANRNELVNVACFQTFRQVAFAGSFEGQTNLGLGVRARLPFRVFVLAGPGAGSRVVIDVAHHW